jgi:RNA polymerase sigma-70 factor (ECF subfamily)
VTADPEYFAAHRAHLHAVAYRMLGSLAEADDAVQETWLRLARSDSGGIENPRAWLTTVVSRVCLDQLRARATRREDPLDDVRVPDLVVTPDEDDPQQHALLADSVGIALLVVLDTLAPGERLAFVLHDVFAVPFDEIGPILDRSPAAAKQLASRARRRLRGTAPAADGDRARQRAVVNAFRAASREGDFAALLALLDPDVVLRADAGASPLGPSQLLRGAAAVGAQARRFAPMSRFGRPVLVNGAPGFLVARDGQPLALVALTVRGDRIAEIDILADPGRLARLDLAAVLGGPAGLSGQPGRDLAHRAARVQAEQFRQQVDRRPASADPVPALRRRPGDRLQLPAARFDDGGRPGVVVVAVQQGLVDADGAGDDQALPQDLGRVPAPPETGQHAVANVAAPALELLVQLVPDRRPPDDRPADIGDQEGVWYPVVRHVEPPAAVVQHLQVAAPGQVRRVVEAEREIVRRHGLERVPEGGLVPRSQWPQAQRPPRRHQPLTGGVTSTNTPGFITSAGRWVIGPTTEPCTGSFTVSAASTRSRAWSREPAQAMK